MHAFVESFDARTGRGSLAQMGAPFRSIDFAGYSPCLRPLMEGDVVRFELDDGDGITVELVERQTNFEHAASAAQERA